jgi:predicted phosphodiesterase
MSKNACVLIISDLHFPYHHHNTLSFLEAIKNIFKPDRIILTGDELDYHGISFHDKDPELFTATQELKRSVELMKDLYGIFPKADVLESNHGSLVYRKQKFHGLPRSVFKDYNDVLEAPKLWKWHMDLTVKLSDGRNVFCNHGKSANGLKLSQSMGMSVIQGHYHSKFDIQYWANPNDLYWAMTVGCMIDDKSLAFAYNKSTMNRPLIGCGIILEGQPKLLPMILDKNGDWIKKIL